MTEPELLTAEQKFEVIKSCPYLSLVPHKSVDILEPELPVIIGREYSSDIKTWTLTTITKRGKQGVLDTAAGIWFSTKYTDNVLSTQKQNDQWWSMYSLEKTYKRALRKLAEQKQQRLERQHAHLKSLVSGLKPDADGGFIEEVLERLKRYYEENYPVGQKQ